MCTSDSLSQFFRVTSCQGSLSLKPGGWSLSLRHLHWSGKWSDCSVDTFEDLTLSELLDVLTSLHDSWPSVDGL